VLQRRVAVHGSGTTVLASLDSERVVEMAWEHPWLSLVLAMSVVEAERPMLSWPCATEWCSGAPW
jgi:hypothetical protein